MKVILVKELKEHTEKCEKVYENREVTDEIGRPEAVQVQQKVVQAQQRVMRQVFLYLNPQ